MMKVIMDPFPSWIRNGAYGHFFGHDSFLDCTIGIHWYFSKLLREPCDFQQLDLRPAAPNFTFHMPTPPGCLDSGAPSVKHAQYPLWAPGWRQAPFLVPRSPFPFTVSPFLPGNFFGGNSQPLAFSEKHKHRHAKVQTRPCRWQAGGL